MKHTNALNRDFFAACFEYRSIFARDTNFFSPPSLRPLFLFANIFSIEILQILFEIPLLVLFVFGVNFEEESEKIHFSHFNKPLRKHSVYNY